MRKILQFLSVFILLVSLPCILHAQERTINGTVIAEDSKTPLAGVTITVKGTRQSTVTDVNGKFTIRVKTGDILQATYVGYETQDIRPGSASTIGITLKLADNTMGEVVVTAMDIKRNPRSLGYSVQKVDGDEIQETQRENFLNSLQGRVAGLSITQTGGTAGASSNIVLRGFNSLAGANQPLFIIDGVIVDNQTIGENSDQGSGLGLASDRPNRGSDYTNRIGDINPNDIESVTVLKGPEATALYGSQANAGAIVITTKKGTSKNGKVSVDYDNSFRFQRIIRTPDVLTKYSAGYNGISDETFSYFGPAYPAGTKIYDNLNNFFQTGFAQTHNLSLEYGKKDVMFRFSGSYFDQQSIVPENKYRRLNLRISNSTNIGKYITFTPSFSIISSNNDKPLRGSGGYMLTLLQWPSNNDARNYQDASGNKIDLYPGLDPNDELDNPFFNVHYNRGNDKITRYIATAGINITPFDWLTVAGRFGYDWYDQDGYVFYHPQSNFYPLSAMGAQDNYYRKYKGYNHTINATARKTFGKFTTSLMVGTMWQDYRTEMISVFGNGIVDLNKTDSNNTNPATRRRLSRQALYGDANYILNRQFAYFGEAGISYNNVIFLNYTRRWEESSTLPEINRKFNYPGASLSIILSDIFPGIKKGNFLNFFKIRTSLAQTARGTSPYSNQSVFTVVTSSGGGFSYGFTNNNFFLAPERQKTYEIGTELRMFKNRLTLDFTYYRTKNTDQIVELFRASYGTGFILNTLNAASTLNRGYEVVLTGTPIQRGNVRWDITVNFNKTKNKVLSLPANVPEFYISDTWLYGNARGGLITGGPTTGITSYGYQRNDNGDILINPANGLPLLENVFRTRGDRNPDFTTGILQSLRVNNWSFSMLWDIKVGGDIYNGTERYLTRIGKSIRVAPDRYVPYIFNGVLKDGNENTANPTVNTIKVVPQTQSDFYLNFPEEYFIQKDVNWFRLRDVTIKYTFDMNRMQKTSFLKSLSVFVTANDLILFTNYRGQDPAVNGNTPATKGVGGIGFDFGNIGTPASVNFGIRAGL